MKRPLRRNRTKNVNVNLVAAMLVPMLLISISAFAYAQSSTQLTCFTTLTTDPQEDIEITNWIVNRTNTQDVNCNGIIFGDELNVTEIKDSSSGQIIGLEITANPIFPGWILHLILKIHNLPYSVPVNVSYAIHYWNETSEQWEKKTKEDLQTLFSITYIDGFYRDADLTQPMSPEDIVDVNKYFYKSEYITLDENAPPTLQGQSIDFIVEVYAEQAGI